MPYCEPCGKYRAPSALNEDGTCPGCGQPVESPEPASLITAKNVNLRKLAAGADGDEDDLAAPWHFKLLVVLLILYLGWRIVDLFM